MGKRLLAFMLILAITLPMSVQIVEADTRNTVQSTDDGKKFDYHLNSNGEISSAKVYSGSKLIEIRQYYSGAKLQDSKKNIKYIFQLNSGGYVTKAKRLDGKTQKVTNYYEYYPKAVYGSHGTMIKYIFDINGLGYVTKATKREKGTKRILSWYEYYSEAVYGKHGKNIKYVFDLNTSGYVTKATKKENGTQRILAWYQYSSKTVYGKHGNKISSKKLNVPLINQRPELPTGCEITAVTMMLQYKGARVNKVSLAKEMPRHSSNPNYGYVGNPFTKQGWTIYPPALMKLVKKHAGSSVNLTGKSNAAIEKQLRNGKPIVVLVSPMHGFSVHALVLTGLDQSNYYYNDCWTGEKNAKISKKVFNRIWGNQSRRAISY
ncbi:C39 family peptidase [Neobacillus kokaensis]|uniref:Peptidase C39-like domain-containing protein n=1 Tax=Neobacillus kokaensis TaxID=2759023 RepID=A0ABQ3N884_9BACI|nr:hypothetical protein AM1BK_09790 [Neobacillus kokaensis]